MPSLGTRKPPAGHANRRHPETINAEAIADLNDDLRRRGAQCEHGRIVLSDTSMRATKDGRTAMQTLVARMQLIAALAHWKPVDCKEAILRDRGTFRWQLHRFRFSIQYYDESLEWASEDPADPDITVRVLTVSLITE